ncbi:hypothetical protein [Clostridium botulinum]|uniref:hypothetical protein n=1 Tax=Clostridium botulinum TaxID=1491 RepID=UPI000A1781CB|nr:hypothetical protein [Clostridium botulinum]OSB14035.1 hypothetical protein B2H96_05295 [Clostridium botulinum]
MKKIMIIRSANLKVINNLIKFINNKFEEEVKIYCLTNESGYENLRLQHRNIKFLIYKYNIFGYKFLRKDKSLLNSINKNIYDELYIPSSYDHFEDLYNVLEIASKIKSKKYILSDCNSNMKEITLSYYDIVLTNLHRKLIKIMLTITEKFYSIIRKIYTRGILNKVLKKDVRVDIGGKFLKDIILYNNRFDYYKCYIELAKAKGYIITSLIDYINNYKDSNESVLILRHDVDSKTDNTKKMFEIECKKKVYSTYYFRWETFNKELINNINQNEFEVGLHYETLAEYCIKNNILTVNKEQIDECREILRQEIIDFNKKANVKVKTVANHGHPYNIHLKVSNNILLEDRDYRYFGVELEAYDKKLYEDYIVTHIMDNNIMGNYGFSYKSNPIEAIKRGDKVIVFLAHPEHWRYSLNDRLKMYLNYKNGNYVKSTYREFVRILKEGIL